MKKQTAKKIAEEIFDDMNGRSSMDTCSIDDETIGEIKQKWTDIIMRNANEKPKT